MRDVFLYMHLLLPLLIATMIASDVFKGHDRRIMMSSENLLSAQTANNGPCR
jgi:hypothetical protein